ncbi:MAG: transporter substrate-binding domain-containing protein [Clostridia bacterium]|nr:transporter substrate-binding domain-containing protein [Clostridia bacterium]
MKKIISLLLIATLMLTGIVMVSCADDDAKTGENEAVENASGADLNETPEEPEVKQLTVNEGKLTMGTNAQFPPYEYYEDGKIVGIDAEIAAAIAEKLGLELVIEDMEFNSIITAVVSNGVDMGLAGMTVTEERLESVNFSTSYATGIQSVIVVEGNGVETLDDLAGKKIGVQLSTTGDIYASGDYGEDNVIKYNKGADAVLALIGGDVQAVIIDNEPAKSYLAANPDAGLKILDTEYAVEEYAAAINKENTELLEAVNKAIEEMILDGTIDAIVAKYIPAE